MPATKLGKTQVEKFVKHLKREGDIKFIYKDFATSIESYTQALYVIGEVQLESDEYKDAAADIFANRAAAYMKINFIYLGMSDTDRAMILQPNHVKAIYRKAQCLVRIGEYLKAVELLEKKKESIEHDNDNEKEYDQLLIKAKGLLEQQNTGEYDVMSLMAKSMGNYNVQFEETIADNYISPSIELCKDVGNGKGRGFLAKEKIKAGALLIVCKAIAIVQNSESKEKVDEFLEALLTNKIMAEPVEMGRKIYHLYAGKELGYLDNEEDIVYDADKERIRKICEINSFSAFGSDQPSQFNVHQGITGIWSYPSYLNHDCCDHTADYDIIGEFIFVRAIRDMEKGQEVTISYRSLEESKSPKILENFECKCRLCVQEGKEPPINMRRVQLALQIAEKKKDYNVMSRLIEKRLRDVQHAPELALRLIPWLNKVSSIHYVQREYKKSIYGLESILKIMKNARYDSYHEVYTLINLISSALYMGNAEKAGEYTKQMKKAMIVHFGSVDIIQLIGKTLFNQLCVARLDHLLKD